MEMESRTAPSLPSLPARPHCTARQIGTDSQRNGRKKELTPAFSAVSVISLAAHMRDKTFLFCFTKHQLCSQTF
jgi:hypothetical protein